MSEHTRLPWARCCQDNLRRWRVSHGPQLQGLRGGCPKHSFPPPLRCTHRNHPTTFYAFTFLRQYILRRAPPGGGDAMHPADNLLIVRVGKKLDESERWKIGGPLIPDVDTALKNYPHQIVNLQVLAAVVVYGSLCG